MDLLTVACGITYEQVIRTCVPIKVEGVPVPLADVDTLIRTKRSKRHRDLADIEDLERLGELGRGATRD